MSWCPSLFLQDGLPRRSRHPAVRPPLRGEAKKATKLNNARCVGHGDLMGFWSERCWWLKQRETWKHLLYLIWKVYRTADCRWLWLKFSSHSISTDIISNFHLTITSPSHFLTQPSTTPTFPTLHHMSRDEFFDLFWGVVLWWWVAPISLVMMLGACQELSWTWEMRWSC